MISRVLASIGFVCLLLSALRRPARALLYALYPGPDTSDNAAKAQVFAIVIGVGLLGLLIYAFWRKNLAAALIFWAFMILSAFVALLRIASVLKHLH